MSANSSVVLDGEIKADGTLKFKSPPPWPPGPVRVRLEPSGAGREAERLPEPPWPDESISAPFDLPRPFSSEPIEAVLVKERLPEPFAWDPAAGT